MTRSEVVNNLLMS